MSLLKGRPRILNLFLIGLLVVLGLVVTNVIIFIVLFPISVVSPLGAGILAIIILLLWLPVLGLIAWLAVKHGSKRIKL